MELTLERGLELDLFTKHRVQGTPEGLDVGPPQQRVGGVGEPQSLHVLVTPHVVEHTASVPARILNSPPHAELAVYCRKGKQEIAI